MASILLGHFPSLFLLFVLIVTLFPLLAHSMASHTVFINEADLEAVAVARWPWCLPHKCEDLGSNPRHHLKIGV